MRKRLVGIVALAAASALMAAPGAFGYSGTLTWNAAETQLDAADGTTWASAGTSIVWSVVQSGSLFDYSYTLTVPAKDISHFILETSNNVVLNTDLFGFALTGAGNPQNPATYTLANGNPDMEPGGIYGVKFDAGATGQTSWTVAFTSTRAPVWGDFYAKCGGRDGEFNTVFNSGFSGGLFNATDFVTRNGLASDGRIAVPDTVGVAVPEASSLVSALIGLPALAAFKYIRKK